MSAPTRRNSVPLVQKHSFRSHSFTLQGRTPQQLSRAARHKLAPMITDLPPLDMTVLLTYKNPPVLTRINKLKQKSRNRLLSDAPPLVTRVGVPSRAALTLLVLLVDAEIAAGWKIAPCHQDPRHQDIIQWETSEKSSHLTSPIHKELRVQPGVLPDAPPSQPREGWSARIRPESRTIANSPSSELHSCTHDWQADI